jgi:hypothetical protein
MDMKLASTVETNYQISIVITWQTTGENEEQESAQSNLHGEMVLLHVFPELKVTCLPRR